MGLQSLLLCRDGDILGLVCRALDELGIAAEVCGDAKAALDRLARSKFDAVVVDCDGVSGGSGVLTSIQKSPSNKRAIAVAVIDKTTSTRAAFDMGAHFVLEKPVTHERMIRALRAANGFMLSERRRYFRQPVEGPARLTFAATKQFPCKLTNISDGGLAITLGKDISPNLQVEVQFELPGVSEPLEAKGEFAWSDGKGNAGIRFTTVPIDTKKALTRWLTERMEQAARV